MGLSPPDKALDQHHQSSGTMFVGHKVHQSRERREIDRVFRERRVTYRKDLTEFYKVIERDAARLHPVITTIALSGSDGVQRLSK